MAGLKPHKTRGLSLNELLISLAIGTILVGIVYTMWHFAYRNWAIERVKTRLRVDSEVTMKRIKSELRLSSLNDASFYFPSGALKSTAVSFPLAKADTTDDRFFDLDADGNIIWDKSVIYHVYNGTLKRTIFIDNTDILTNAINATDREDQLADVVGNGGATNPNLNAAKATTKPLVENVESFTVTTTSQIFDGYSSATESERSDEVNFGVIRLDPSIAGGEHDFRFEIVGKNGSSDGHKMGIDSIVISPSGGTREAELCAVQDNSGGSDSTILASGWSGNKYLKYTSGAVGDYITLRLYYDVWQEANFAGASKDNAFIAGDDWYIKLKTPKEGAMECWTVADETNGGIQGSVSIPTAVCENGVTVRNVLSAGNILEAGGLVRVKFSNSNPAYNVKIYKAYIANRLGTTDDVDPAGTTKQLFFGDAPYAIGEDEPAGGGLKIGNNGTANVTLDAGEYAWSNWADFAVSDTGATGADDYFVTFYVKNVDATGVPIASQTEVQLSGREDTLTQTRSYCVEEDYAAAGTWGSSAASLYTYLVDSAEDWPKTGSVIAATYDTQVEDPNYEKISWQPSSAPPDSTISVKVRSGDNPDMSDAPAWESAEDVTNDGTITTTDGGRYIEFQATLTKDPDYADYPNYPWIDNVTINWPGGTTSCRVSCYFTKDDDYGILKLTVDGQEFTKGVEFNTTLSKTFRGKEYETSITSAVEPRNTGR